MARKGKKEGRRYRTRMKVTRHRMERTAPHSVLGTMIGSAAAAIPFIAPDPMQNEGNVLTFIGKALESGSAGDNVDAMNNLGAAGQSFISGIVTNFVPILGLTALGAGVSWAGRKYARSSTNVSRKWRVF
jgi:hypothetical protein